MGCKHLTWMDTAMHDHDIGSLGHTLQADLPESGRT